MTKIRINKEKMNNHATTLGERAGKLDYYPLKNGNMSYTQTNSINLFRESLLELLEGIENLGSVAQDDANRIKQMGEAFAKQDKSISQKMNLEVR
ncbi:DUF3130 family protein [Listeria monocytogenes]|uniref:DUF3130 family protein n=1 Tax=Listeria monocytogenes TaxID=1639 RepID=UPI0010E71887|nr:DUF3130 family protein [Listeria monocytogenes]EAD2655421.1 DUF3130 family protein [Listeria monocytogenes]EAF0178141.1 DUF3130 family protein [Listeria monocytogenes]EAF9281105.1 DUF3130 family protein [Listeria monocytogenes]EAV9847785.1 DUF3130 family protein [Listeria monocytogenes]EAW7136436.1 DUF3130 family protein [Listeria monocytogenes]